MSLPGRARLAFYMPTLECGGVERVFIRLAAGFADCGHSVDLVTASDPATRTDTFLPDVPKNVAVVPVGRGGVLASLPGLIGYLRRARPDALVTAMDHANLISLWAKLLARSPVRVVAGVHTTESLAEMFNPVRDTLIRAMLPYFLRHSAGIVAVSFGVAEDYARFMGVPRERLRVIYNPAVGDDLYRKAEADAPHPWFAEKASPLLLSIGRLSSAKNYPLLIRAMRSVHARTGARLVILGDGAERPRIEAEIRKAGLGRVVDLPGFEINPYAFIKRADALVLSSSWEGLPTVLVEAMALGTPVISTDCPNGPAEILENGRWGRLVPVDDEQALAEAVIETLRDPRRDAAVARAGDFTVEKIIGEYAEMLGVPL